MCMGSPDIPDIPEPKKPDPVVTDENQAGGGRAKLERDRSKVAAMYGEDSMRVTGGIGLPGGAQTAGKKAIGG